MTNHTVVVGGTTIRLSVHEIGPDRFIVTPRSFNLKVGERLTGVKLQWERSLANGDNWEQLLRAMVMRDSVPLMDTDDPPLPLVIDELDWFVKRVVLDTIPQTRWQGLDIAGYMGLSLASMKVEGTEIGLAGFMSSLGNQGASVGESFLTTI